jgi:hypothetical protein
MKYASLLSPADFEVGNQLEEQSLIRDAVHESLSSGRYLQGGRDENVSFLIYFNVLSTPYMFAGEMQEYCTSSNTGRNFGIFLCW